MCAGDPHSRLVETAKTLSDSCTKLTLLFIRPPPPSLAECGGLCAKLDQATLSFVNASYSVLRAGQGAVYSAEVRSCVLTVLSDLDQLITAIMTQGCTRYDPSCLTCRIGYDQVYGLVSRPGAPLEQLTPNLCMYCWSPCLCTSW